MKNKFIILTITGLLLASLAACGGSKTPDASKNTADQEAQNQNQDRQGTSDTIQGDIEEITEAMIRKAAATVQKMQAKTKVVI